MKKLLIAASAIIVMSGCSNTINDKAEKVIEKDMAKTLVTPDTYNAIETEVDSAFAPLDDPKVFNMILDIAGENVSLNTFESKLAELKENMKNAEKGMNLINNLKGNKYSEEYNKYKSYYDEYADLVKEIEPQKEVITRRIQEKLQNVSKALGGKREFIGFKAIHKYSAENNQGKELTDSCFYLLDKDMNNVLFSFPLDKYRLLKQSMEMVKAEIITTDSI